MNTRRCAVCEMRLKGETKYISRCPRFPRCSTNACPLDFSIRRTISRDPEQTCKAHLRVRLEIAKQAEKDGVMLPWRGFRPDEQERLKAGETVEALLAEWDAREAKLRERGVKGRQLLKAMRAKSQGSE